MVFSRGLLFGRTLKYFISNNANKLNNGQSIRKSHVVSYRVPPPPHSKATVIGAELVGAAMWWWILWHLWHEYEHITGEFEYPSPEDWSDTELGIPKDN